MKNINLESEKIEQICQQWQIEELALFGSILREDFNSKSDIDVLVSFAESAKITFFDLDTIEQQLSKLFDRPVDVVTKRSIEQSHNWIRKKNILDNAQIIYEQRQRNTTGYN
ncbi:MAG: nucleotidyltransferase domain-containing protein [Xenococcaceae cyanobacterium MO_188.B29]|nr:nucleotidyltransferase domain-containing protein [Xenococcaceae cyanobacterium MO_188.B29]